MCFDDGIRADWNNKCPLKETDRRNQTQACHVGDQRIDGLEEPAEDELDA